MDFDHRLENKSFATVRTFATMDREGFDVALVIAKVAFRLSADGRARLGFRPVRAQPQYDVGSIRFPHDVAAQKTGTDVGLVGTAYPTLTRETQAQNRAYAWLQVGMMRKVIQIFGPRVYKSQWNDVSPSEPGPLRPVALVYENAWGGRDVDGSKCEENPVGRGFARDKMSLVGQPAPSLEPVHEALGPTERRDHAGQATFGPIPEHWEPRAKLAGTHDEEWLRERHPVEPADMDLRHHSWSTPALHSKQPLLGDEPVEVAGVLPEGVWRFKLPLYPMRFEAIVDDVLLGLPTHLDGMLIDADERVVELSYRATVKLPKKWERLSVLRALSTVRLPEEMLTDEEWPKAAPPRYANDDRATG